jgi:hypothetical protein
MHIIMPPRVATESDAFSAPQSRGHTRKFIFSSALGERFCEVVQLQSLSGMWLQDVSQHYLAKYFYVFTFAATF